MYTLDASVPKLAGCRFSASTWRSVGVVSCQENLSSPPLALEIHPGCLLAMPSADTGPARAEPTKAPTIARMEKRMMDEMSR